MTPSTTSAGDDIISLKIENAQLRGKISELRELMTLAGLLRTRDSDSGQIIITTSK